MKLIIGSIFAIFIIATIFIITTVALPCVDCFVQDIKYTGPHIKTVTNVVGAHECQKVCQDNGECSYFAWNSENRKCYLKESTGSAPEMEGWISGPKVCAGNEDTEDEDDDKPTSKYFNQKDQIINYAWSDSGSHLETPYDSNKKVILLDMDVDASKVKYYKDMGHTVIGYISVGSWEEWRDDIDVFSDRVIGPNMSVWVGEKWFNLQYWQDLKEPMKNRMIKLKEKGFDGYEGDNIGIYIEGQDNLKYKDENIAYAIWLAKTAHNLGLSATMKNGNMEFNLAEAVSDDYDAIIVESAFLYDEIDAYKVFADKGKPIWSFEYHDRSKITNFDWVSSIWFDIYNGWEQLK